MPFARLRGKTRAYLLTGAAAALLVLVAMLGGVPGGRAQTSSCSTVTPGGSPSCIANCVPTTTANVDNCTFSMAQAIAPGGTMVIQLTNPTGAVIQALAPPPPIGCALTSGSGTAVITVSCATASIGWSPSLTPTLTEAVGNISAGTNFITQVVTYNANGAAPQVPNPITVPGACFPAGAGPTPTPLPLAGGAFQCINTPAVQTVAGGTLTFTVFVPPSTTATAASIQITGVTGGLGTCFVSAPFPPQPPTPGQSGTLTVTCATGQSTANPPAPVTISGVATAGGFIPQESTTANANGPTSAEIAVPDQLTIGTCTPIGAGVGATGTCTNTPGEAAQAGQTLVFGITAAAGQTIQINSGASPTPGCDLSTTLPSSASFVEGTIPLTYTCTTGETAAAVPYAVTVTNVNGVAGTPSEVTSVNTQGPPQGVPPPTTNTITFTISSVSVPGTPIGTPVTPGTPTAVPQPTTTAVPTTGPGTFCSGASCTSNSNCVNPPNASPPAAPATGQPPAVSSGAPYAGTQGQPLQLKGVTTPAPAPPGGKPVTISLCTWDFGDGTLGSHFLSPTHVYGSAGLFTATLTVTDSTGQTTTVTTPVGILASPPLCQNPLVPTWTGLSPCTGAPCPAASFNNQCAPLCPLNGATLLPNQCPGPATGNAIWTTGPFNVQVDDPVTVTVNTTLPATSPLLAGAAIKFDFGDGAVVTNTPQGQQQSQSASTTSTVYNNTTTTTTTAAGTTTIYPFPPSMQAIHAYTQPGNYTIKVTMTYSDGTTAFNQTQATVSGQPPGFPTSPLYTQPQLTSNGAVGGAPAQPAGAPQLIAMGVPLMPGCNNVTLTFPNGTPASAVAAAVQGAPVTAIYETPPNAPSLAYYPGGSASAQASNLATVQHGDAATICVSGAATLNQPPS
jgi:PKD domain